MCQKLNFRQFIEEITPTIGYTSQVPQTVDYVAQSTATNQGLGQNHMLSPLIQAMKRLDPFISQNNFSGTPDFTSPEQAKGQGKESDSITNLYYIFKRTKPQMAEMLKPVATAFKQFENDFLELCHALSVPLEWKENEYLATKIDRMTITNIYSGIQAFSAAMQQIQPTVIQTAQWKKMQQSFQRFTTSFNAIQQQLLQQLPQW